jgi:hypothetical protein
LHIKENDIGSIVVYELKLDKSVIFSTELDTGRKEEMPFDNLIETQNCQDL